MDDLKERAPGADCGSLDFQIAEFNEGRDMDERGVPRRGARPALWFSDDAFSMAVGNEWTMDSPTDWVVGEGEDERRSVKVHSTSTESRPVPRVVPRTPASFFGGDPGGGGSSPPPCQEGVLGGWAALISGRFHWQRNPGRTPRGASTPLQGPAVSANPCFEITRMLMIRAEEENGQTSKRANVPQASRIAIGEGPSRGKRCRP